MRRREGLSIAAYAALTGLTLLLLGLCLCLGSAPVPVGETLRCLGAALTGQPVDADAYRIIVAVRLPRVLCAALVGAALALSGAAMQGLLRNPLADGATLGVSAGASLGAVIAIALGLTLPGLPFSGTAVYAMAGALVSLLLILLLAGRIDGSFSTNTVILLGVIYSMLCNSLISLTITFAGSRVRHIAFWTLGSLSGSAYADALLLLAALILFGGPLLLLGAELNAFATGEENARHMGVNVRRVRLTVLICVSALTGVAVSVAGTIGFVGLVIPHMARLAAGPNYRKLLPACLFAGAGFLLLCDLLARAAFPPLELPIGVISSLLGAGVFLALFFRGMRVR